MSERQRRQRMSPEDRRAQIVSVARDLMIDEGYGALSFRAVAARCNVTLAAIQHHYRDKGELFKEVIEKVTSEYDERNAQAALESAKDPERRLHEYLRFLISEDNKSRRTAGFFYELWNLAHRDPLAADAMTRLYDLQLDRVCEMIRAVNPGLDSDSALARAGVVVAATDGLILTIGSGKSSLLTSRKISEESIIELVMGVVWQPVLNSREGRDRKGLDSGPVNPRRSTIKAQ